MAIGNHFETPTFALDAQLTATSEFREWCVPSISSHCRYVRNVGKLGRFDFESVEG